MSKPADNSLRSRTAPDNRAQGMAARMVATQLLTRIVDDGRNLDALTDNQSGLEGFKALGQKENGDRDQQLARAIVIAALRNRMRIEAAFAQLLDRKLPQKARLLHHGLHVAAAQILFMDVPDSAAANLCVTMIGGDKRTSRFKALANAVLRRMVREKAEILEKTGSTSPLPQWFAKALRRDYGKEKLNAFAPLLGQELAIDLTFNLQRVSAGRRIELAELLGGLLLPTGSLRLKERKPIPGLPGFAEGEWWVQDAAASIPARLLGDVNGKRVADFCAAPGGKTAQLIAAGGIVTAVEQSRPRLLRLNQNLERLSMNAETVEADILEWRADEPFDAILLDAPCSSTGTIRRHPDVLWTKSAADIDALADLQYRMIRASVDNLAPNGMLVFSNCSIFKREGEDVLARIVAEEPLLEFLPFEPGEFPDLDPFVNGQGALRTTPAGLADIDHDDQRMNGLDSFFACRFRRKPGA